MGRPPKKPADRRTVYLRIPVTVAEKRKILRRSRLLGISTAELIRRLALGE